MLLEMHIAPVVRRLGFEWNASGLVDVGREWERGRAESSDPSGWPPLRPEDDRLNALFEANPEDFFAACPGLHQEMLGYDEEPPCLDFWIHHYPSRSVIVGNFEFVDVAEWLTGHGHGALGRRLSAPAELDPAVRALAEGVGLLVQSLQAGSSLD